MRLRIVMPTLGKSIWWRDAVVSTDFSSGAERVVVCPEPIVVEEGNWRQIADAGSGLYAAVNSGFRSEGDWDIGTYLNDDDRLLAPGAEAALKRLRSSDRIGAVFGRVHLIDTDGRRFGEIPVARRSEDLGPLLCAGIVPLAQPGTFFRREMFDQIGGFDESWRAGGDIDFFMRAWRAGWRFEFVNADVAEFRVSGGQISQQATAMKERDYLLEKARNDDCWTRASSGARLRFRWSNRGVYWRRWRRHGLVSMQVLNTPEGTKG